MAPRHSIHRADHRFFRVVTVAVEGTDREVPSWARPLVEPVRPGVIGFAYRTFYGALHLAAATAAAAVYDRATVATLLGKARGIADRAGAGDGDHMGTAFSLQLVRYDARTRDVLMTMLHREGPPVRTA
jgi:hypothetical protein